MNNLKKRYLFNGKMHKKENEKQEIIVDNSEVML